MNRSLYLFLAFFCLKAVSQHQVSLNGEWLAGENRDYELQVHVPGIVYDPSKINANTVWLKKEFSLPEGTWNYATFTLNGARFSPTLYINSNEVGTEEGGMAPIHFTVSIEKCLPGEKNNIEISLKSLGEIKSSDASYIPKADQWRSNVSSLLWDDVSYRLHGDISLSRIIPYTSFNNKKLRIKTYLKNHSRNEHTNILVQVKLKNKHNQVLFENKTSEIINKTATIELQMDEQIIPWSPENPELYMLEAEVFIDGKSSDIQEITYGFKDFRLNKTKKGFILNGHPVTARAASVVWHRWIRNKEGYELGWDTAWFRKNIVERLKSHGANTLRFHLGTPPERFLGLCDQYGLMVQYEWSFFHGMPASEKSLLTQWRNWLDLAMRHPSVCLIHPYNETEGSQLDTAWAALKKLLKEYPPMVLEERDVIHVHKYWWSLFENLGLYYDDADQFPKAIMVDEFGGNYLDGDYALGGYKTLKESYMRFLGWNHTKESRKYHHTLSNAKVAEYWRNIGAAGFSPFCALGSWEDGNHWFEGPLLEGKPKPVWDAMTAAYSPRSVTLENWDRTYTPGQNIRFTLHFYNETADTAVMVSKLSIKSASSIIDEKIIKARLLPYSSEPLPVHVNAPSVTGKYTLSAELINKPAQINHPVISTWDIRVFKAAASDSLKKITVGIPLEENELPAMCKKIGLVCTSAEDENASMLLCSRKTWEKIQAGDKKVNNLIEKYIDNGKPVMLLDVGDLHLGQGYPKNSGDLGPLQGVTYIKNAQSHSVELVKDIQLTFREVAEPESHIHPGKENNQLWSNLSQDQCWLWNGLRGGLIVPACEMEISGLNQKAFLSMWEARGANPHQIYKGAYFAYELQGFYAFSENSNDSKIQDELRKKVKFLADDAPALANSINPHAPISEINLHEVYLKSKKGEAISFTPLVNTGKNLTRVPVVLISFGDKKGKLLISQLMTQGRMAIGYGSEEKYGIRYDESSVQFVINMLDFLK